MKENMKKYIGTKEILARPMSEKDKDVYMGYDLEKTTDQEGYLVEYTNSPNSNHKDHEGYLAWSPKGVFEEAYRENGQLNFGDAIRSLKLGQKVQRSGWNGKGMFLFLIPGSTFKVSRTPLMGILPEGKEVDYCPHIDMKTADDKVVPWLASQTDVLSEDWSIID